MKRIEKVNADKVQKISIQPGTEVYYPNKKLSNKAEGYSAELAHRFLGPAIIKRIIGPMVVELASKDNKIIGKYYIPDLKFSRRSLRNISKVKLM